MKETNETLFQISKQMYNYINQVPVSSCHDKSSTDWLINIYWHIHEILLNSGFRDVSQDSDRAVIKKFLQLEWIYFISESLLHTVIIKSAVPVGSSKKITITALFMSVFAWFDVLHVLLNSFKNDMIRNLICFFVLLYRLFCQCSYESIAVD